MRCSTRCGPGRGDGHAGAARRGLVITPWNFPIAIPAWKIAPALAYGNTVVFKPAELVPGERVGAGGRILHRGRAAGRGCSTSCGAGQRRRGRLADSADVAASRSRARRPTGARRRARRCAARFARSQLEMGGKNPLVVLDDADLDLAVRVRDAGRRTVPTGQRCTASVAADRHRGIHDDFVDALVERMRDCRVATRAPTAPRWAGRGRRPARAGLDYLAVAREGGRRGAFGGERLERAPTATTSRRRCSSGPTNEMPVNREEIFGPVASVIRVADHDEALAVANDTEFGLSGGIVTTSLAAAPPTSGAAPARDGHGQRPDRRCGLPRAVRRHAGGSRTARASRAATRVEFFTVSKTSYVAAGAPLTDRRCSGTTRRCRRNRLLRATREEGDHRRGSAAQPVLFRPGRHDADAPARVPAIGTQASGRPSRLTSSGQRCRTWVHPSPRATRLRTTSMLGTTQDPGACADGWNTVRCRTGWVPASRDQGLLGQFLDAHAWLSASRWPAANSAYGRRRRSFP